MADFGVMFDVAQTDTQAKIKGFRDAATKAQDARDRQFAETIKPLTDAVIPVLQKCKTDLDRRGVLVDINFDEDYNIEAGQRIPAANFRMTFNGIQSRVYIFEIRDRQFTCSADDGSKKPWGQRGGVFATSTDNMQSQIVEDVVKRAIADIMQAMEHAGFMEAFPNATIVKPA